MKPDKNDLKKEQQENKKELFGNWKQDCWNLKKKKLSGRVICDGHPNWNDPLCTQHKNEKHTCTDSERDSLEQ